MARSKVRKPGRGGVVAAGHEETAKAGVAMLESGGNAVDAALAAAFTACVAEPCLIALGAGGFMLVHDAESNTETLLDYFVAMPGQELEEIGRPLSKLTPTPVDFGETVQMFHSGHASNGVPGFVAGMFEAHRRFGRLPMAEIMAPAQELARNGVVINRQQDFLFELLHKILWLTPASKMIFAHEGERFKTGETFRYPEFAETLDELLKHGAAGFYEGELAAQIVGESDRGGGRITAADLANYQVIERKPTSTRYRGAEVVSNPPPSSGGALIIHSLNVLEPFEVGSLGWHSDGHLRTLIEAMRNTNQVRTERFDGRTGDEDVLDRLLAEEQLEEDRSAVRNRLGNTTHISVIDGDGNAVSMTNSNGAGSGVQIPGTGIQLNSMLGEEDLNPGGFHRHRVGSRIPSMMSPTVVLKDGTPTLAIGSAGSNRIRSAVLQTISGVLDFGMSIEEAVEAYRVHVEGDVVELEGGIPTSIDDVLAHAGLTPNRWDERNLFFGGVNAVERDPKSARLAGHGDSRRGGASAEAPRTPS